MLEVCFVLFCFPLETRKHLNIYTTGVEDQFIYFYFLFYKKVKIFKIIIFLLNASLVISHINCYPFVNV